MYFIGSSPRRSRAPRWRRSPETSEPRRPLRHAAPIFADVLEAMVHRSRSGGVSARFRRARTSSVGGGVHGLGSSASSVSVAAKACHTPSLYWVDADRQGY